VAALLHPDIAKHMIYAEGPSGQRLGADDEVLAGNNVIKFTSAMNTAASSS